MQRIPQLLKRLRSFALSATLHPLIGLLPRKSKNWVFGSLGGRFAGNPKYLFLWMTIHQPDVQVTWITGSRQTLRHLRANGFRVRARWSLPGLLTMLRAGVFVYGNSVSDISFQPSNGAFLLNLWHGIGVKSLAHHDRGPEMANEAKRKRWTSTCIGRKFFPQFDTAPDVFVTTSEFTQRHFAYEYSLPLDRCPQLGYPRLDCAFDHELDRVVRQLDRDAGFELNSDGYSEIYFYMPTFRDSGRPFFTEALPDPAQLSAALAEKNALLYIKPHPSTRDDIPEAYNIRRWPDEIDFQPYLADISGLITDYSSVLYDYLIIGQGTPILYTFDLDQYRQERSLSHDYENNIAGLRIDNFAALCATIHDSLVAIPMPDEIANVKARFWDGSQTPASPAIVQYVARRIGLNVHSRVES